MFGTGPHERNALTVRLVTVALWRVLSAKERLEALRLAWLHHSAPMCIGTIQNGTFLISSNFNECELIYYEMVGLLGRSDQVS